MADSTTSKAGKTVKESALLTLGVMGGVTAAVVAKRATAERLPVPAWLTQLLLGGGLIVLSASQKAEVSKILMTAGVGSLAVAGFGAVKEITSSAVIPTINGVGMPGAADVHMLPTYSDPNEMIVLEGVGENVITDSTMF